MICCYNGRVKRIFFTSDECGLFNRSGFPTFQSGVLRLYSRCAAHLFIYCQLHVTFKVTCTMLQKQVSVFSIFINTVYKSLKSNLCLFHMKTFLPPPICLSLGAETRTPKNSPHKCLIQILII